MEANAKKPKAKARPKLNPTENAALKRLEHDLINEDGIVPATKGRHAIHCLTVIGTIEGHTLSPDAQKTTKYEHVIPQLVDIEEDPEIEGLLVILNTVGGDVEAGLALAELIAGVSKPSATLVLGGGHSIGIPLAVAARHSFIVPTATMTVHPVRHSGMVLGVPQTLRYFEQMQERIVSFVTEHSKITARRFTQLMHNTGELVMDMGTGMAMGITIIITAMAASARRTRRTNVQRRSKLPLKGVCFVLNDREQVGERSKDTTLGKSARSFLTNGTNTDNIPIRVKFLRRNALWGVV